MGEQYRIMPYCSECGTSVDDSQEYCHSCGAPLGRTVSTDDTSDDSDGWDDHQGSDPPDKSDGWKRETGRGPRERRSDSPDSRESNQYENPDQYDSRDRYDNRGQYDRNDRSDRHGQHREDGRRGPKHEDYRQSNQKPQYVEDGRFNFAIKFPISNGYGPVGGGAICSFLSFFILPMFTLYGYVYRITGSASRGETVQPTFSDDLVGMSVKGLVLVLLYVALAIVGVLFVGAAVLAGLAISEVVAAVIGIVFGLIFIYIAPAILTLYPATGSATVALSPRRIAEFAFTGKYFIAYLGFILLNIAINIAFFIVAIGLFITIIGIFLLFPLMYVFSAYVAYVVGAYWGATYYEAVEEGIIGDDDSTTYQSEPAY